MINIDNLENFVTEELSPGERFSLRKEGWIEIIARLRQAEKDAARYRWLDKSSESWRPGGKGIIVAKVSENYERPVYSVVSDLGALVDEAMQCK